MITVNLSPDPGASSSAKRHQAESESFKILQTTLNRYLGGEIKGRSILISGHRGAGKTTLVDAALRESNFPAVRPLRVSLYGPSLFPNATRPENGAAMAAENSSDEPEKSAPGENDGKGKEADATQVKQGGTKSKADGKDDEKKSAQTKPDQSAPAEKLTDAQRVLMELTVGLYRSLVREVAAQYANALGFLGPSRPLREYELPGRLILDLDDAPGPDRLRKFWLMAGALERGVLFGPAPPRPDQGIRELVALSSAAQAFRVVSGKLDLSESRTESAEDSQTRSQESKLDLKALLTAGLSLASGLFGALGVYFLSTAAIAQDKAKLAEAIGTGLAALVAAFSASRTATRTATRKQTLGREYKFIRDFKLDTLGRELPNLIERIRDAGLAPVFVVDELDKVPNLAENLRGLVRQLKPLVAEQTFFCFLTDREYYEHLRAQSREVAYAPEHTYFTHRLFVAYDPEALAKYIDNSLEVSGADREAQISDCILMRLLILYRARMHAFDTSAQLQRLALTSMLSTNDRPKLLSDTEYLHPIIYQVAVQTILYRPDVQKMAQDSYLRQVIHDALYYPAECWDRNMRSFSLTPEALRNHLVTRMHLADSLENTSEHNDEPPQTEPAQASPQQTPAEVAALRKVQRLLSDEDFDFIFKRVEEMVGFLANPRETFPSRLKEVRAVTPYRFERAEGTAAEAIPRLPIRQEEQAKVLTAIVDLIPASQLLKSQGAEKWEFAFDAFGRPLEDLDEAQRRDLLDAVEDLPNTDSELNEITTALGDPLDLAAFAERSQIFDRTQSWTLVQPRLERLRQVAHWQRIDGDDGKNALAAIVYFRSFQAHFVGIGLALGCAQAIQLKLVAADRAKPAPAGDTARPVPAAEGAAGAQAPEPGLGRALDAMARLYQFASASSLQIQRILRERARELLGEIYTRSPDRFETEDWYNLNGCALKDEEKAQVIAASGTRSIVQIRTELWSQFRTRLLERRRNPNSNYTTTTDDLLCAAAAVSPPTLFSRNIGETPIARWTTILRLAFADQPETAPDYVPIWMGLFAALELRLPAVGANLAQVKPPPFKTRTNHEAEMREWNTLLTSLGLETASPPAEEFLLAVVSDSSRALEWCVGKRVTLVTQDSAGLTAAVDLLFPAPSGSATPSSARKIVLREGAMPVPAADASRTSSPSLPRVFSDAQPMTLAWSAGADAAAPTGSAVVGTSSIDELKLPPRPVVS
jgi:hypothetical protein